MTGRRPVPGLVALFVALLPALAGAAPADPPAELEPGARGKLITTLEGHEPREIPLSYLGTYRNFAGPGFDLHLVRLEGEIAEKVGAPNGMSGSPVYVDGRLIGALSYRLGRLPKDPVAGVTPIEDILDASRGGSGTSGAAASADVRPIATPVFVGGLAAPVREWLAPHMEQLGFVTVAGGGDASAGGPRTLGPGAPVGVELIRGDMRIAATGTVTLVDGDAVYAFGHPFMGAGQVEMPMVTAEVIHTLADLGGGVILANLGTNVGSIVEDRQAAVVGQLGRDARMIPMRLSVNGGDYGEQRFGFEVVRTPDLAPLLAATAAANALITSHGYARESTLIVRGALKLAGLPELPLEMAYAGSGGSDPAIGVASRLYLTLGALLNSRFREAEVEGLELRVEARKGIAKYRVESLHYDRKSLEPGQPLRVECVLRAYRGETETHELLIDLPESLPRSGSLILAVGSPGGIDQVLGGLVERRLRSAQDLESVVRVLSDLPSADRLTAVVYQPGGTVVSRGTAYTGLPPTAERLLSLQSASSNKSAKRVAPLSRTERMLDGPVEGGLQVRLRIDRDVGTEEER